MIKPKAKKQKKTAPQYVLACQLTQVAASIEAARAGVTGARGLHSEKLRPALRRALEGAQDVLAYVRDEVFRDAYKSLHGRPFRSDRPVMETANDER